MSEFTEIEQEYIAYLKNNTRKYCEEIEMNVIVDELIPRLDLSVFKNYVEDTTYKYEFSNINKEDHPLLYALKIWHHVSLKDMFDQCNVTDEIVSQMDVMTVYNLIEDMVEEGYSERIVDLITSKSYKNFMTVIRQIGRFDIEPLPNEFYKRLYQLAKDPNDKFELVKHFHRMSSKLEFEDIDGMIVLVVPSFMLCRNPKSVKN